LLTHHHHDHVMELDKLRERWPDLQVLIDDREPFDGEAESFPETVQIGELEVRALHTPGHTAGMLALVVDGNVFTGDTLFKNSVGGVRAPGSTSYADLKHSVMEVLLALPDETVIRPGHTDPSTVADEKANNAFVRVWNGVDAEGDEQVTVWGKP